MRNNALEHFKNMKAWGLLSCIDLYECDAETIRSVAKIREFVLKLCDLIEMKRFGDTQVVHFGEDEKVAGYSMTQLIETSLISAHFANLTNTTYLDVFSCKPYDPQTVAGFARDFFQAQRFTLQVVFRGGDEKARKARKSKVLGKVSSPSPLSSSTVHPQAG
jgi:S-adenosylmethionine/arginine decarboxylase-like enzyme